MKFYYGFTAMCFAGALAILIAMQGCGSGFGKITIKFAGTASASTMIANWFIPPAYATVNQVVFCFKRLRFKLADEDTTNEETSEDNIDFELGLVTWTSAGVDLGEVQVDEGVFKRLEFDFEDKCNGKSVEVTNSSGTFNTTSRATAKFRGTFDASESDGVLSLGVDALITALDAVVASGSAVKDAVEDASLTL